MKMKRSSSSSWLARAVVLLAIIVCCFLLPCSAGRAKGAGFNFPTGMRVEGIRPKSPKPGAPRAQNCPGCGHDYARPPPATGPSKQQNCPECGHAYALPPPAGTSVLAPAPPCGPCLHSSTASRSGTSGGRAAEATGLPGVCP
ncbi:hypothetical protein ACQJBY_020329 [Aegilops geniculata]